MTRLKLAGELASRAKCLQKMTCIYGIAIQARLPVLLFHHSQEWLYHTIAALPLLRVPDPRSQTRPISA